SSTSLSLSCTFFLFTPPPHSSIYTLSLHDALPILDLDGDTVNREAKHGVPVYYGDATNPNVLRHMKIEDAKVLVVAISDPFITRRTVQVAKGLNPKLHVVVRTRYLRDLEELHQLGADDVVPEEFGTSIEIFS